MGKRKAPKEETPSEEEVQEDAEKIEEAVEEDAQQSDEDEGSSSEQDPKPENSRSYQLRPKSGTIFDNLKVVQNDLKGDDSLDEQFKEGSSGPHKRRRKKKVDILEDEFQYDQDRNQPQFNMEDIYDDKIILDKLPKKKQDLERLLEKVKNKIAFYKRQFLQEQKDLSEQVNHQLENSIPIFADIRTFNFDLLRQKQLQFGGRLFDVIMMDPPWKLSTSQPSRGVAIQYESLGDEAIETIPVNKLQDAGFIFVWAINAKYHFTIKTLEKWGYKVVDQITWVKKTVNGKIAKGHGYYLQHAKESCIVGVKGEPSKNPRWKTNVASDVIFSERRGQSQKPTEIYEYIEKLVPNGFYLEIFGRRNNLRNNWVTIGNEL